MKRPYLLLGLIAPLAYFAAVVIGGAATPGYDHIYHTISELTAAGSHPDVAVVLLFAVYNIALLGFGALALLDLRGRGRLFRLAMAVLALIGLLGAGMYFFPQDPRGAPATTAGTTHIALAAIISPLTMLAILLVAADFRKSKEARLFSYYSIATLLVVLASGGATAYGVANDVSWGGLAERVTIGAFILWVSLLSAFMIGKKF